VVAGWRGQAERALLGLLASLSESLQALVVGVDGLLGGLEVHQLHLKEERRVGRDVGRRP
jgi:hypothetical protein